MTEKRQEKIWKQRLICLSLHRLSFPASTPTQNTKNAINMKILTALSTLAFLTLASVTTTQARDIQSFNQGWEYSRGVMIPWGVY
ncbi:MAG: hypothetical protein MJZ22_05640, partial [Candidatus Saccharibacteria bacterium]|nr:hypothetical protein [Candidatus Saccharibacteria bacterium]